MEKYYVSRFNIKKLWGQKDFDLKLNKDVNIIIGPNASGKTTLMNALYFALSSDIINLSKITFKSLTITLAGFQTCEEKTINIKPSDRGLSIQTPQQSFTIPIEFYMQSHMHSRATDRDLSIQLNKLREEISSLVSSVWLPVTRRLPIREEEDYMEYRRRSRGVNLESVDECLKELLTELAKYRARLDSKLSQRYKEFEKRMLELMLYNKDQDMLKSYVSNLPSVTLKEKERLINAFKVSGLLDKSIEKRIDEHWDMGRQVVRLIKDMEGKTKAASEKASENEAEYRKLFDTVLLIPIITRTKAMVEYAEELDKDRKLIFESLDKFVEIANSFIINKTIQITDDGILKITVPDMGNLDIIPQHLSSGEKQILILLIQALLFEEEPVIYIADEPELSLHVIWQEKLLQSLVLLGREIQVIVATHSPDIVGPYKDKVIDLAKL